MPASILGWTPATDYFLLGKDEDHGPFPTGEAAVAASQRNVGSYGYGNVAPDLKRLLRE